MTNNKSCRGLKKRLNKGPKKSTLIKDLKKRLNKG